MYPIVDHHVTGGLDEALAIDDVCFPVILRQWEVVELNAPHTGGPGVRGGVAIHEEVPEGLKGIDNVTQVRLFIGEEAFK